jgi:hypothetical protein
MKARFIRKKASGQSIPLIALMIVVLFAMVGLAVDVGNTYAQQRNTVRASNSAALAGMTTLINGGSDEAVFKVIGESLKSNSIVVAAPGNAPQSGERVLVANYLDARGNPLASCPTVGSCGGSVPQGVSYIRVNVGGKVDTYFARVLGRPDLPVGANAYAGKGSCLSGVYPITIKDTLLGQNGFVNPTGTYSDNVYRNKTWMRIPLHDFSTHPNGGFGFVKWLAGQQNGSATDLAAALTGPGNIADGFNEVTPWPSGSSIPKPPGYPINPGRLEGGDWVYGNAGISNNSVVRAQLDWHMQKRTVMTLPIFDQAASTNGVNGNYHISRLGAFLLKGYELNGQGYFDLVYLGNSNECPYITTPPAHDSNLGVIGQVSFRPRYRENPSSQPPVEFEVILDVSGSMTWKFDGYGWNYNNNRQVLCTGATGGCSGLNNYWPDETKRRIYIAKQALNTFVDGMGTNDVMRIVTFSGERSSPSDSGAITSLTKSLPSSGWSSDKTVLKQAIRDAGMKNNNPYLTDGRTPSAVGIAAGSQVLASAPTRAADGQEYERVVIFITDGVANIYRDGTSPTYDNGCGTEVASCQVGYVPNTNPRKAKPITAMLNESDRIKQQGTVYVIALAGVEATGLPLVASQSRYPFYSESPTGNELAGILANIQTEVKYGDCVPSGGNTWENTMDESEVGDVRPPQGPVSYPTVGYAYLYDQNKNLLPNGKGKAPIMVDPSSGKLVYQFNDLTPGTYILEAFVGYRGEDDISRIYRNIFNPNTAIVDTSYTFQLSPANTLGTIVAVDPLLLDTADVVCP